MFEKQVQSVAAGGIAIQADGSVQVGVSYEATRQIALDVYHANFPTLVSEAAGLARARAEELTDKFLTRLVHENPTGFNQATQPDFQNALLNAQRDHACAGDAELADLLVDLLVDRTKQDSRNVLRLVLDEALKTAPKLTEQQLAVLGVAFVVGCTRSQANTWVGCVEWMTRHIKPTLEHAVITKSTFSHLQFTGCVTSNGVRQVDLAPGIFPEYAGFFQTGFTDDELLAQGLSENAAKYIKPLTGKPGLKWVAVARVSEIESLVKSAEINNEDAPKLRELLTGHLQSLEEFRAKVLADMPFMQRVFDMWAMGELGGVTLTSVGMAIGHAYIKKTVKNEFAHLSIWIE
ncbi:MULTISPECIES: LPO_1073/Vpar_1526 family protein [unclassified Polaromonas]|uniref:LPO_1073/Vpar_1526 family protein n=1 Tax=unclassified Polaromonas TaxID=2638319 RepID=UPI0018CB5598|nr:MULTISPECIES: LPO_1073/Vpar_1526 family protein [unclassified Polaromonas]MBG6074014.1 hypothetical protein [Polaromonas sp. CG_9.7]MBG6116028.1 hypothetical protein [Polaromonas sp. CG_9.2]